MPDDEKTEQPAATPSSDAPDAPPAVEQAPEVPTASALGTEDHDESGEAAGHEDDDVHGDPPDAPPAAAAPPVLPDFPPPGETTVTVTPPDAAPPSSLPAGETFDYSSGILHRPADPAPSAYGLSSADPEPEVVAPPAPLVDPDYARILAMADKFAIDPRDIIAAGQLLSDQGMDANAILATLEKRYADATPAIPAGTVLVVHGTYQGPGCPDRHARKRPQDVGFAYDAHHPAQPGEVIVGLPERDAKRLVQSKSFQAVG